jgi:putative transposase
MVRPSARRLAVACIREELGLSERLACRAVGLRRSTCRYAPRARTDGDLRVALREEAARRSRFGYRRLHVMLRRKGWVVNHKCIYRLYRAEGLAVRRKSRKKLVKKTKSKVIPATRVNQRWGMDFVSDTLGSGRVFRTLTIVDEVSKKSPAIIVEFSIPAWRVVETLERLKGEGQKPEVLTIDNGPEFRSGELEDWAHENEVELRFSRPGKPTDNPFCESFNGKFREECLNENYWEVLPDAKRGIEAYRIDHNDVRPHSSLGNLSPAEFLATIIPTQTPRFGLQL